ncbi:MAG: DinB family protein [Sorangiineae bacterium]|nr:DinB family protein [Polyangiaceae bacterium]MEB2324597.1 DinB family protein [Sorangiineae bacterium]
MLITDLGNTRRRLLATLAQIPDDRLDHAPQPGGWTPSQIIRHLYATELATARAIQDALEAKSEPVADLDPSVLRARITAMKPADPPSAEPLPRAELIRLLEESRFRYLQAVFNKTHESTLATKSTVFPELGRVSLKNLVDFIWLHESLNVERLATFAGPAPH